jgi:hypothetical protein
MSKIKGFYSALDKAAEALTRNKGTGKEFITELSKVKGIKPTEIQTRKLERIIEMPKMSKEEFLKKLKELPLPQLRETQIGEPTQKEIRTLAEQLMHDDAVEEAGMTRRNRFETEDSVDTIFEDKMYNEEQKYLDMAREQIIDEGGGTKYPDYKTEGGENYREILMRLPSDAKRNQKRMYELEAKERRSSVGRNFGNILPEEMEELNQLRELAKNPKQDFQSKHWEEPNVLAHMRVQDRISPTYTKAQIEDIGRRMAETLGVDAKSLASGSPSVAVQRGVITPLEAAQFSHAKKFKNVDTTGATQKVLHVEEIQSDWHQKAREIRKKEIERVMKAEGIDKATAQKQVSEDFGYKGKAEQEYVNYLNDLQERVKQTVKQDYLTSGVPDERAEELADKMAKRMADNPIGLAKFAGEEDKRIAMHQARLNEQEAVPDAPFKKNWHELAMKRLLNYAAENGYDKIAVTPGAEQAKRYDLSKHISKVRYFDEPNSDMGVLHAYDLEGNNILNQRMSKSELEDHIGKDATEKLLAQQAEKNERTGYPSQQRSLSGLDLQVGGEGMQSFYDTMIPSYLNEFGKKYNTQVSPFDIEQPSATNPNNLTLPGYAPQPVPTMQLHGFDITPEMREEINTQGLPMFSKGGKVKRGGRVHVSQNPDTMLLDLISRN